jgi:hypothetical protein
MRSVKDDDHPATMGELRAMEQRLQATISSTAKSMVLDIGGVVQRALGIGEERAQAGIQTLDDRYKDVPGRLAAVERDVAELKGRPPSPASSPSARRKKSAR